ncbi:response regulator [Pseudidiomarina salilacus]|uniref:response regulator n=1 Tax=Pseudidiomarina salilacus TaxID=3384452 RepID=UPI003985011D
MIQLQAKYPDKRVGVVDDNATNLMLLEQVLLRAGYAKVVKFSHPVDVLEYLHKHPLDILLCDHHMPCMSGIELFRKMKTELRSPPVTFLVTAVDSSQLAAQSNAEGMAGFISKPFDIHKIVELLDKSSAVD